MMFCWCRGSLAIVSLAVSYVPFIAPRGNWSILDPSSQDVVLSYCRLFHGCSFPHPYSSSNQSFIGHEEPHDDLLQLRLSSHLPSRRLRGVSPLLQNLHETVAVIALDLDTVAQDGPPGRAPGLESFQKRLEVGRLRIEPGHNRNPVPAPLLAADPGLLVIRPAHHPGRIAGTRARFHCLPARFARHRTLQRGPIKQSSHCHSLPRCRYDPIHSLGFRKFGLRSVRKILWCRRLACIHARINGVADGTPAPLWQMSNFRTEPGFSGWPLGITKEGCNPSILTERHTCTGKQEQRKPS